MHTLQKKQKKKRKGKFDRNHDRGKLDHNVVVTIVILRLLSLIERIRTLVKNKIKNKKW